jgi:hypothetical protein
VGGGGGRSRGISRDELTRLETRAKDALVSAAQPERRNVFISFATEDLDHVNLLRGQAKNEDSDLEFNDWSLREPFDSDRAEYIKNGIRERIRQSSVTLVYVSDATTHSAWVDWEVRESISLGKGVIAVHSGTTPPLFLPPALTAHGIQPIPWTHDGIGRAIERASRTRI